jgi:hypothetical protein
MGAQMLRDIDENGGVRELDDIDYRERFDSKWNEFTPLEQRAIDTEINRLLDALRDDPDPNWGSIMNTSIEGGKVNPFNGEPGDWTGTPGAVDSSGRGAAGFAACPVRGAKQARTLFDNSTEPLAVAPGARRLSGNKNTHMTPAAWIM